MDEAAELQAKIAAIAGKINQHKQHSPPPPNAQHPQDYQYTTHSPRANYRWSPYGRGGKAAYQQPHKNRSLVIGSTAQPTPPSSGTATPEQHVRANPGAPAVAFVSTRALGKKELMTKEAFDREQKQKLGHVERGRVAKRQKTDREEKAKLIQHASKQAHRELLFEGIRFQLRDDGSKLTRISGKLEPIYGTRKTYSEPSDTDSTTVTKETPKKVSIADVDFFRTTSGNLVRANVVRDLNRNRYLHATRTCSNEQRPSSNTCRRLHKPLCENFTKTGTYPSLQSSTGQSDIPSVGMAAEFLAGKSFCSALMKCTGTCSFGPSCHYAHDPNKVAVCKTFLHKGHCPAGDNCDLSHDLTYHRVPACTHFLRDNCTNDACRYPHVQVSPTAPVCRSFASLGFCSKGEECEKRHVVECPDYSNHGKCENKKCALPHIDHANIIRKAAARQEDEVDMSSDDEPQIIVDAGSDDVDSDAAEDVIMGGAEDGSLSQQQDYVAFS